MSGRVLVRTTVKSNWDVFAYVSKTFLNFPRRKILEIVIRAIEWDHLKKVVLYAIHRLTNLTFFGRLPYLLFYVHVPLHFANVGTCIKFLAPLAVGQRAYVMVRCPSCVRPSVRPSVRALTFSLNIFFAETTYRILMKFHRNVPTMVLFRISWNNLIPSKTLVAMATKLKIFWNLWKSSCQKP